MAKNNKTKEVKQTKMESRENQIIKWLPLITFILAGILVFYPPFFKGLFFKEDMFVYHIFTAIVFALVWINKIYQKDYTFIKTPLDWAILAYAIAYLLSLIGAVHPGEAFYGFLKALNYFMVYWIVTEIIRDYKNFETILKVLLAAGTGVAVIGILAATGYSDYPAAFNGKAISSTLQYPNTTAAFLAVMSLIGVTLWIRDNKFIVKNIYGISTYLLILVVFATLSKGAWLIFAIGFILLLIGMPGIFRLKSIYSMLVALVSALVISSRFIPAITGDAPETGLPLVLIGMGIIVGVQALWELVVYLYNINKSSVTIVSAAAILLVLGCIFFLKADLISIPENIVQELLGLTDIEGTSFSTRSSFNSWGIQIIKDYPINGTGAGGWNALYHQYQDYVVWTTEVHNHFIQVGVEAGLIGLIAFLAMWIMLIYAIYSLYKLKTDNWVFYWGVFSAAISFGMHAAIDFDLSLPAMAILLWTFFALVNSALKIENISFKFARQIPALNITLAVILTISLLFTGTSFVLADNYAKKSAKIFKETTNQKEEEQKLSCLNEAIALMDKAYEFNKFNASYLTDKARFSAIAFKIAYENEFPYAKNYYQQTKKDIEQSIKLAPYDLKLRKSLLESSILIGDPKYQIANAQALLKINPNDVNSYNNLIDIYMQVANYYLNSNKIDEAKEILIQLVKVKEIHSKQLSKINEDKWRGSKLELTPDSKIALAKANYLLGNYEKTKRYLEPFATNLLALEFDDTDFEKTEFENENWKVRVVEDKEAQNGKCVEIEAKKDMQGWPAIMSIASNVPVIPDIEYLTEIRYKVIKCSNSPDGDKGPRIGIWGNASGGDIRQNTSVVFHNGELKDGDWSVFQQKQVHKKGINRRYFRLGTGSVAKGTKFRIDYIKFNAYETIPENIAEPYAWYAGALFRLGNYEEASDLAIKLKEADKSAYKICERVINIEPL